MNLLYTTKYRHGTNGRIPKHQRGGYVQARDEYHRTWAQEKQAKEAEQAGPWERYFQEIKGLENGSRTGWSEDTQRWLPHASVEGGNDTIAYGHKLTKSDIDSGRYAEGLTEQEALKLLRRDIDAHFQSGLRSIRQKYGDDVVANLSPEQQVLITDFSYNLGNIASKFPKFTDALINKDYDGMLKEYKRYTKGRPLARNKWTEQWLERYFSPPATPATTSYSILPKLVKLQFPSIPAELRPQGLLYR